MFNIWNFWADKYDKLWVQKYSLQPTRAYIIDTLRDINNKNLRVLDLGCGPGQLIRELTDKFTGLEVTGLDFSEKMLEISNKINPGANHIKMDTKDLSKLDNIYDLVICTHSMPYYKDPKNVFKELYRILDSEGQILVGFASGNSLYDKIILGLVKLTTGKAAYPSDKRFRHLIDPYLRLKN